MTIDINCDMGEGVLVDRPGGSVSVDELIMPFVSSANIACGAHAGNAKNIAETISLAKKHRVGIGAHPGFPDKKHFGRIAMPITDEALAASLKEQISLVCSLAGARGMKVRHVKPHGALYNMAAKDQSLANLIAGVVYDIDRSLIIVGPPASELEQAAYSHGLYFAAEAFADRGYNDDGTLVSRALTGALIEDAGALTERALMMIVEKRVISIRGNIIPLPADTLCIHGDNPHAPELAKCLFESLQSEGIQIKALSGRLSQKNTHK